MRVEDYSNPFSGIFYNLSCSV